MNRYIVALRSTGGAVEEVAVAGLCRADAQVLLDPGLVQVKVGQLKR